MAELKIGTCSWKYESWRGILYSDDKGIDYLSEYSQRLKTVEIDQWFWSLFDKVVLPDRKTAEEYKKAVSRDFKFTIKIPNSLTLTHYYNKTKGPLKPNPYFLSVDLCEQFLEQIEPLLPQTAALIMQFEYLNKEKMPSFNEFQRRMRDFASSLPYNIPPIAVEIRNPNYFSPGFFTMLSDLGLAPVFLEGYYMPPITETYKKYKSYIKGLTVIRLHGSDRSGIEKISGNKWDTIYINRDNDLTPITEMISELLDNDVSIYLNVNNHYEGCAPLTIDKIKSLLNP